MIKKITIITEKSQKLVITLNELEPSHGLLLTKVDGLGPVTAEIKNSTLPMMDGVLYNSSRANNRTISLYFTFVQNGFIKSIEDIRQLTYKYFKVKSMVILLIETDNRTLTTYGYVSENDPDIFSQNESCKITIECPNAHFEGYGKDGKKEYNFSSILPLFEFEFENDSLTEPLLEFGDIITRKEYNIYYDGEGVVGVEIDINVTSEIVKGLKIINATKNEIFTLKDEIVKKITGDYIKARDHIYINTNKGEKEVYLERDGKKYNLLNATGRDISWFQISYGDNMFTYLAEEGEIGLDIKMWMYNVFEGV
jgi:hypothetical protein